MLRVMRYTVERVPNSLTFVVRDTVTYALVTRVPPGETTPITTFATREEAQHCASVLNRLDARLTRLSPDPEAFAIKEKDLRK